MNEHPLATGGNDRIRRILFVTNSPEWVGPNISLMELVTRLPRHLEPLVVMPEHGPLGAALDRHGVPTAVLRLDKWGILSLVRTILSERIALVYGNSASNVSKNALVAAKLTRRPFVFHLREMARTRNWKKRFLRYADQVIAVSRASADSYQPFCDRPIEVVYNGVPLERFSEVDRPARGRIRAEIGASAGDVIIAHVGNVCARKGQLEAIATFDRVSRDAASALLILLGRVDRDVHYVGQVRSAIDNSHRPDRIQLQGFREDVKEVLLAADVFVHTAKADPHPRAVIEAMAASLPVVAFDVDGVGESVVDGETGYLVSAGDTQALADRLLHLVRNADAGSRLGGAGRHRATRLFSAQGTADRIASILRSILQERETNG